MNAEQKTVCLQSFLFFPSYTGIDHWMKSEGTRLERFGLDQSQKRKKKPRVDELTMVMDKGLGITSFQDGLELAADYIDFIKLGFGTLCLTPLQIVRKKLALAKKYQVALYPGGTLFEWFAAKGKWMEYFQQLSNLGFTWVEITDGIITLDPKIRAQAIQTAKSMGFQVMTEIGKKSEGSRLSVSQLIEEYYRDLALGASYVIIEGRETGENIGVFNERGEVDTNYVTQVYQMIDEQKLIWEAPKKMQQVQLLHLVGPSVNFGNIPMTEILSVEALRRGLRADTFQKG